MLDEKRIRGIKTAITILTVILIIMIIYIAYCIFYPNIENILMPDSQVKSDEMSSNIKDNENGYIRSLVDKLISLTNEEREKEGLEPLKTSEKLVKVADYKVLEMSDLNYFEHDSPKYGRIDNQFKKFGGIRLGIEATVIGENLAKFEGYDKSAIKPEEIIKAWMDSPEHRENILKKEYNAIGISIYYTDHKICYASQEFMLSN
jgi:uncharacterized protein YkwD